MQPRQAKENTMTKKTRIAVVGVMLFAMSAIGLASALADAQPPTNGGNGGGQSGQCTGNPDGRPASCGP
jgi:Spy/CpxP family protein refolding chaperone